MPARKRWRTAKTRPIVVAAMPGNTGVPASKFGRAPVNAGAGVTPDSQVRPIPVAAWEKQLALGGAQSI